MNSRMRQRWEINKFLWMNLAFVLAYIPLGWRQGLFRAPLWVACLLFGIALLIAATRTYYGYRHGDTRGLAGWLFMLSDIVLISAGVAITRGIRSELWLLYFITIIAESLYATPRQTLLTTAIVAICYLLATLPTAIGAGKPDLIEYGITLGTRLFFLRIVGAYGRRISYNATTRAGELLVLREQMATVEERARIAREIHDGLGHALVSVILRLELCARLLRKAPEEAEAILKEEIPALRAAWNEGRDMAFHLRPWESDVESAEPLPDLLRRSVGRFAERTGIGVHFAADGEPIALSPATVFGLSRIVQEALTNAAKHACASRIDVLLQFDARHGVACTIRDDGDGFDVDSTTTGVGLQAMRERARALGGAMEIRSSPGAGAEITLRLPT